MFPEEIAAAGFVLREMPHGVGAAVGTSVHRSAQVILLEKASTGTLPPVDVATDCARDNIGESIARGVMFDGPRGATQNGREAVSQAVRMAALYHRAVAPNVQPLLVEERLEAEAAPGLVLSGQPDLVAREPNQIRDLKTGAKQGNHNAQAGGYSLLARSDGIEIEQAAIDYIKRVPPSKPQPDPVVTKIPLALAEQVAANVLRHIAEDLRIFREGDRRLRLLPGDPAAFLANPSSVLCSRRWCPAHSTGSNGWCREHLTEET